MTAYIRVVCPRIKAKLDKNDKVSRYYDLIYGGDHK